MPLLVGLTGGIASGKSSVAALLADLGAVVIDADAIARAVLAPGAPGVAEVVAAFGPHLAPDGVLDRAALGALVFADEGARARLNAIVHPRVRAESAARVAAAPADAVVVQDIPLLVETGAGAGMHLVIVVTVPLEERVRRAVGRGMGQADARSRIAAQAGDAERVAAADVLLDNAGSRAATAAAVETLWHGRIAGFAANLAARTAAPGPVPEGLDREAAGQRLAARLARATGQPVTRVGLDLTLPSGTADQMLVAGFVPTGTGYGNADPAVPAAARVG